MIQNTKVLYGNRITSIDGDVGTLRDFYFDDRKWLIRYVVANTGSWLPGRTVLFSPHSLGEFDPHQKILRVGLQRKQIEDSPPVEPRTPVSRHYEADYYRHYGLPAYWPTNAARDPFFYDAGDPEPKADPLPLCGAADDKYLQSAKDTTGFRIEALDGIVGHVSGFLVDDRCWSIPALVVEAGHWYSEKEVLIFPNNICEIGYKDSTVFVNLTKSAVRTPPDTDLEKVIAGDDERNRFHD